MTLEVDIRVSRGDFSLSVKSELEGSGILGVYGPSGSGKTSLLRSIAGLEKNVSGSIIFAGEHWLDTQAGVFVPAHRRAVGFVFQDARLFPFTDVAGNLDFADSRSRDAHSSITRERVIEALDLSPLLHRGVAGLSGGERQRVAMGRVLLSRPAVLLMDEPLSALDQQRKTQLLPYISRLAGEFGLPVVYVSHQLDELAAIANTLLVLDAGDVIAQDSISTVLQRLDISVFDRHNAAVSVFDGEVLVQNHRLKTTMLGMGEQRLTVPQVQAEVGARLRLQFAAKDIALAMAMPESISIRNRFPGHVMEVQEDSESAYADVLVDIGAGVLRARITREALQSLGIEPQCSIIALVKSVSIEEALPLA
ncbi:molybdate ABC transporter, ATP-binding protein [Luminiphilus syltensis NOR5-1B]|uniref:Molybdate ABC transporter, ATP-binding protein n=1 Tax=Luminiphilus syltensis NOR5-1B TaxID=565045 RepID=B8KWM6_9GAMM|nr:molybdenum ABC transporter ATP-binding protein [Luminiphilus syltensis]EED36702.1 molybdate ABC transporter, ATP-binding protein [Luminiphilus syltensis NOR5-1B]